MVARAPVLLVEVLGPRAVAARAAQEQRNPWRQGPEQGLGPFRVLVDALLPGAAVVAEALLHSLQLQLFALQGERPGARERGKAPGLGRAKELPSQGALAGTSVQAAATALRPQRTLTAASDMACSEASGRARAAP